MANIKSQKKRILTNEKARIRNVAYKSKVKTAMKKVYVAVEAKDLANAEASLKAAFSVLDRAVVKGILTRATAARRKKELQLRVNSLKK